MTFNEWWTRESHKFPATAHLPASFRQACEAAFEAGREAHVKIGVSSLNVKLTDEGVIMDAYDDDLNDLLGTMGMTYDEWFDFVIEHDPANKGVR
jgi:hypothetical protein